MPRLSLIVAGAAALGLLTGSAQPLLGVDSHLDPSLVTAECQACHRGHGLSRSPMLIAAQQEVCLSCHGSKAKADQAVSQGILSKNAEPQLLSSTLALPYHHPMSEAAFSGRSSDEVACTSCHSPHRGMAETGLGGRTPGRRKLSPRDPGRFEFELCQECHGDEGVGTQSPFDLSRLTNPNNTSYHPVEAPTLDRARSTKPRLSGKEINCTDCHGNSDASGPRGPHGSEVRFILRHEYTIADGSRESKEIYALCYECHERDRVLDGSPFPLHRMHVVELRASCATCHSAHGSVENRALIRFGEETFVAGVGESIRAGVLAFDSLSPGSGSCYLTCHGVDHAPESYGAVDPIARSLDVAAPETLPRQVPTQPRLRPKRIPDRLRKPPP